MRALPRRPRLVSPADEGRASEREPCSASSVWRALAAAGASDVGLVTLRRSRMLRCAHADSPYLPRRAAVAPRRQWWRRRVRVT